MALSVLGLVVLAASPELPWAAIPEAASLSAPQRAQVAALLAETPGYGDCRGTVAGCLAQRPPPKVALRLGRFTAFLASEGVAPDDVRAVLAARLRFGTAVPRAFALQGRPSRGAPEAPIVVVELADFECPYCRRTSPLLHDLVARSGGMVRQVFLHFPLKSHPHAEGAARIAEAALRQGRFWDLHDLLVVAPPELDQETLLRRGAMVGCDAARLAEDAADPQVAAQVRADRAQGEAAGVRRTPTFFINGRLYDLAFIPRLVEDVIDEEAERLGRPPPFGGGDEARR